MSLLKHSDERVLQLVEGLIKLASGHADANCSVEIKNLAAPLLLQSAVPNCAPIERRLWPAAHLAAELCTDGRLFPVAGRRVLEIGCGVGLSGLACAACGAVSVELTDKSGPTPPH